MMNGGWVNSWNDRKGLSYGMKAFAEEFSKDENVEMIVKINSVYGGNLDENLKDLDIQNKNPAEVKISVDNITPKSLNKIYNKTDVFVTTSKAEAFNMPPLEAMACGKPVISTNFGGMTDFITEENGWLLKEGELEEVKFDTMYESVSWKNPNISEIRKVMRYVYNNKEEIKQKNIQALEDSKKWTWDNSARIAYDNLKQLNTT